MKLKGVGATYKARYQRAKQKGTHKMTMSGKGMQKKHKKM